MVEAGMGDTIASHEYEQEQYFAPTNYFYHVVGAKEGFSIKISGYLSKKKSGGRIYIYLRRSFRENKVVKHQNIYSFGAMPGAMEKLYWLRDNPECFPNELTNEGFDLLDLYEWILTIETGITTMGRKFIT